MALALFGLTTEPRAFVVDLERRGLSPRVAFAAAATLETIPMMVERALSIQAEQRARGLDTEGSLRARIRGVLPLVAPVILSSLTEVEERSLALEVRSFGRPGRRDLLWTLPGHAASESCAGCSSGLLVALVAPLAGVMPRLPTIAMLVLERRVVPLAGLRPPGPAGHRPDARGWRDRGPGGAERVGQVDLCLVLSGLAPASIGGVLTGTVTLDGEPTPDGRHTSSPARVGVGFQNPNTQRSGVAATVFEEVALGPMNLGCRSQRSSNGR